MMSTHMSYDICHILHKIMRMYTYTLHVSVYIKNLVNSSKDLYIIYAYQYCTAILWCHSYPFPTCWLRSLESFRSSIKLFPNVGSKAGRPEGLEASSRDVSAHFKCHGRSPPLSKGARICGHHFLDTRSIKKPRSQDIAQVNTRTSLCFPFFSLKSSTNSKSHTSFGGMSVIDRI